MNAENEQSADDQSEESLSHKQPARSRQWRPIAVVITVLVLCSCGYWWSLEPLDREILRLEWGTDSMKRLGHERLASLVAESEDPLPALAEGLRRYGRYPPIPKFSQCLRDRGWEGERALPALETLLDHEEHAIREGAARMLLGLYGSELYVFSPSDLPTLLEILEVELSYSYPQQLQPTLEAIEALGPEARPAIPVLFELLHAGQRDRGLTVVSLLASISPDHEFWSNDPAIDRTAEILVKELDRDTYVQRRSGMRVYALGSFTMREQDPYFDAPSTFLVEIGPPAVPAVLASVDDDNFRVREKAALILGLIGADLENTIPALMELLNEDTHPRVRRSAAQALGEIGPKARDAIPALVVALEDETDERELLDILPWSMLNNDPWSISSVARGALARIDPEHYSTSDTSESE